MGIPKLYRWLSERYPSINEDINQYNVPEFDYFYIDMNGVFHTCAHSNNVHKQISEEKIFQDICFYIEYLFNLIRPKKVFFLAVDGVAPRSKMNQQRSRRFRKFKEMEQIRNQAIESGESSPETPTFDSNCITPGTEFMLKLNAHLIDFVAKKIQKSIEWQEITVIFSGCDVAGEGEHKIMDYIRYNKTLNLLDADSKHCIYGLDADLIMVSLSSHEPYFAILREEVIFSKNQKSSSDPMVTNFQLLHISILRDYIYHEFLEIKPKIKFPYVLEKIIDDLVLIIMLLGNDFIPNLPRFHIHKHGLQILFDSYKSIMPILDGYLNTRGKIHFERFHKFLKKLSFYDQDQFNHNSFDFRYLDDKTNQITFGEGIDLNEDFDFENMHHLSDNDDSISDESNASDDEFRATRNYYYQTKLQFENLDEDVAQLSLEYMRGIQWVLHYYYDGCVSWEWFYPYHYAPYVSDLANVSTEIEFIFKIGSPLEPLIQLLAVLPSGSKELLPKALQKLTYLPDSPLIEFFPLKFQTDLNEKINEYESIVLMPFIDQKILLKTFDDHRHELTPEDLSRNIPGSYHFFSYVENLDKNKAYDYERFPNLQDERMKFDDLRLPMEIINKELRSNIDLERHNGFPRMNGLNFKTKIEYAKIKVFRFQSQNMTLMIEVEKRSFCPSILQTMANEYVGKIVNIDWPLIKEAKLISLLDNKICYEKNKQTELKANEIERAKIFGRNILDRFKNKRGIVLDSVEFMAKVLPLSANRYSMFNGEIKLFKQWDQSPIYIPLDIVLFDCQKIFRMNPFYQSLDNIFKKNHPFYLIANPHYGSECSVIHYNPKQKCVSVVIHLRSLPLIEDLMKNYTIIMQKNFLSEKKLASTVAKSINVPEIVVRRVLGSVMITFLNKNENIKRINVGLKFKGKKDSKPYCLPGYSCYDVNEYFFVPKVIEIVEEYHRKFPEVFQMLINLNKPVYDLVDLFPDDLFAVSDKIKKLNSIRNWFDSISISSSEHIVADAEYLDNCIIHLLEKKIIAFKKFSKEETVTGQFLPENFYIPEFDLEASNLPDPKATYYLFDRVVNIKRYIPVPFGAKGYIVGIIYPEEIIKKNFNSNNQNFNNNKTSPNESNETNSMANK
ncbi:5'-3' exoribonuclease 1 [Sarcoptes scabiei]|uniref:5'-3' exoribonuclease 1 n=1 Tax=Sarcoptes scabiei TaxID=52283 RepID=A0A834R8L3_SARSC|nr:5'-3' exoribonuclease 1 [Sarcoptes scabiei]